MSASNVGAKRSGEAAISAVQLATALHRATDRIMLTCL
jgi:hypothetical protein